MKSENILGLWRKYHDDKKKGIKRQPLHTLKECCEEACISSAQYGHFKRKYPGAPEPRLTTPKKTSSQLTNYYVKADVLAYIKKCINAQKETK